MVSIGAVWDKTVDFVRRHARAVMPVVLATQFAPGVVSNTLAGGARSGGDANWVSGPVTFVATIIALWGALYLIGFAAQSSGRERAAEARGIANGRFFPLIGVSLVLLIAFLVLAIPGVLLAVGSGFDFVAAMNGTTMAPEQFASLGTSLLYFVVLGLVMLWLFARLLPINAVIAMERRGLGAIGRAFALTRGMALKLVGVLILYGIVAGVATVAVQSVLGVVFGFLDGGRPGIGIGTVAAAIGVAAVSSVLTLYQSVFVAKLYRTIVGEKDEADVFA